AAAKKVGAAPHRGEADMTPGVNRDRFSVFSFQFSNACRVRIS
ncbi:hypothetical protein P3T40_009210, partial [Paraburkholderia sp. EB58]